MRDRIRQVMEAQHMTQQTFANFIGMSAASLSSIFNNRTKPTLNTVEAIKNKIPNISIEWLLFGKGSMYGDDKDAVPSLTEHCVEGKRESSINNVDDSQDLFGSRSDVSMQSCVPQKQQVIQTIKPEIRYLERPKRQITEIRVFFDDGTYETFAQKK